MQDHIWSIEKTAPAGGALERAAVDVDLRVREGRFQRWLALIAASASVLSGLEVAYEHYRGSYSRRVMYTPVILSGALAAGGLSGFFSRRAARTVLPAVSVITIADCAIGFYFHVRGVQRKPGGWRLPIVNMIMGPPVFAPLLFAVSAYLGFLASLLRRGELRNQQLLPKPTHPGHWAAPLTGGHEPISWQQDVREGRFQKQMAAATIISAFLSGAEAWYSHYKNNFRYKAQWTPVIVAPMLMAAGAGAIKDVRVAHTWLPAVSALAMADGVVGFVYHARGVARRPGGMKRPIYNIIYGPPLFAPLLFAASGFLGLLASLLRREKRK
ncbi:MAG: hypothetical protein ABI165_08225 [Bryobacteraceae bacterium]